MAYWLCAWAWEASPAFDVNPTTEGPDPVEGVTQWFLGFRSDVGGSFRGMGVVTSDPQVFHAKMLVMCGQWSGRCIKGAVPSGFDHQ